MKKDDEEEDEDQQDSRAVPATWGLCLMRRCSHREPSAALTSKLYLKYLEEEVCLIFYCYLKVEVFWSKSSACYIHWCCMLLWLDVWTFGMTMSGKWVFVWTAVSSQSSMPYKALWEGDYLWPHLAPSLVIQSVPKSWVFMMIHVRQISREMFCLDQINVIVDSSFVCCLFCSPTSSCHLLCSTQILQLDLDLN